MGQKIHPVGLRLGITRTWDSRWFEKKNYKVWLHEDVAIRKYFARWMRPAAISKIEIERRANQARILINTGKPGIIIGKRGVGIEEIRKNLEKLSGKTVQVNVVEIKHIELDARLVAQNIVDQLEKRIAFRRAMKQAIMRSMKAGARGIKVQVSGRLGGAEIARRERNHDGKVPLHTLRADIDYAHVEAFTTFGRIGVKVWIYRGEVLPDQPRTENRADRSDRATFRDRRDRAPRAGRTSRSVTAAEPAAVVADAPAQPANATDQSVDDIAESPSDTAAPVSAEQVFGAAEHEVELENALAASSDASEQSEAPDQPNTTEESSDLEAEPTQVPDTNPAPAPESAQPTETSPQGDPQPSHPTTESTE
ncbi:MAG: 30S ribosomal protein S3 [Candidatus Meridianibacter frigidus]|nr:MAG: 30S ribosomal protein S3 [Candidatus Eremiobacteraeota bacterium]